jgi:hypothetical protein
MSVWLDPSSAAAKTLGVKGHSIVTLSIKKRKILNSKDFGNKIEDFTKALEKLKQK